MQKEKLSALMDGEMLDNELLSSLSKDWALQQSWQSYHLIRDTLRGDIGQVMHFDIADRVAAALEKEPARLVPSAIPNLNRNLTPGVNCRSGTRCVLGLVS